MNKFFYSAVSADGFVSLFEDIYNIYDGWTAYIIKGCPGCGKSTFMKQLALKYQEENTNQRAVGVCSSDVDSVDTLVFYNKKVCIMDGTLPHAVEPKQVGLCETILNFTEFLNDELLLNNRQLIQEAYDLNSHYHKRAQSYVKAVGSLIEDDIKIAELAILKETTLKYAKSLSKRLIKKGTGSGTERKCYLGAVTHNGYTFFEQTAHNLCDTLISIEDEHSVAANIILNEIKEMAIKNSYDFYCCYCPILPNKRIEHIIIPELSLAFCTSNKLHKVKSPSRCVHANRFYDQDLIYKNKNKMNFNKKVIKELINAAASSIEEAKKVHNEIEWFYINAMDFGRLDEYLQKLSI